MEISNNKITGRYPPAQLLILGVLPLLSGGGVGQIRRLVKASGSCSWTLVCFSPRSPSVCPWNVSPSHCAVGWGAAVRESPQPLRSLLGDLYPPGLAWGP